MKNNYTIKKYGGDDVFSWAVFYKKDVSHIKSTQVGMSDAYPIVSGLSRRMASDYKKRLEQRNGLR